MSSSIENAISLMNNLTLLDSTHVMLTSLCSMLHSTPSISLQDLLAIGEERIEDYFDKQLVNYALNVLQNRPTSILVHDQISYQQLTTECSTQTLIIILYKHKWYQVDKVKELIHQRNCRLMKQLQ